MGTKMIFLRGEWDSRTLDSIKSDDDMWLQLCREAYNNPNVGFMYDKRNRVLKFINGDVDISNTKICFSRGGFPWQAEFIRKNKFKFIIRYGAGRRIFPEQNIKYDLILVDSGKQKRLIKEKNKSYPVELFIKPAAKHFKYIDVEKKYDICFIAKDEQASFKGVRWVYNTVPKSIKVLHIGSNGMYSPPRNVTCMRIDRIDMPEYINMCKIGVVPYWNEIDSCPRIIPEMMACGVPVLCSDQVHYWRDKYQCTYTNVINFWGVAKNMLSAYTGESMLNTLKYYNNNLSIKKASQYLKNIMLKHGCDINWI